MTYAKIFGGFFAVTLILAIIFSVTNTEAVRGSVDLELVVFGFASIGIMFISGIITGAELSMYVRQGVARNEYFKAAIIGAIIVSVLLMPFAAIANQVINLITRTESLIYSLTNGNLLTGAMHILLCIVFFLGGYLISMIYQRFGWFLGIIITLLALLITGVISWNFEFLNFGVIIIFPIKALLAVAEQAGLVEPKLLGLILVTVSVILASGTYALVKNTPVKIK